jgi:hypothetical protein
MGAVWETVAFVMHSLGALDQQNIGYANAYSILFLLAPLWINAFVYMTVARMIHFFVPEQKVGGIKSTVLSKLFVWADVVTFLIQGVGGSMTSSGSDPATSKIGLTVYMVGIGVQEGCILSFAALMLFFHRRMTRYDAEGGRWNGGVESGTRKAATGRTWKWTLLALYGVLVVITVCGRTGAFSKYLTNQHDRSGSSTVLLSTPPAISLATLCPSMRRTAMR